MSPSPWARSVANDVILSKAFSPTWDAKTRLCILEGDGKSFTFLLGVKPTTVQGRSLARFPESRLQAWVEQRNNCHLIISLPCGH